MPGRSFGIALGELIYRKRKALGLTQTQLAEDAFGTSAKIRRISELENGTVANPHPKTIDPLIAVLRISEAELEGCAKETNFKPDINLDRAYREARNLIESVAKQFEHSKPNATIAELDEFLRAKAKEWVDLRDRIEQIGTSESAVSNIKSAAAEALSNGDFERADLLLSNAEDVQQESRTLVEVRKQSKIRIARADICFFRDDIDGALQHYSSAAEFLRPFDESEMVLLLERLAERIYAAGKQSLKPSFFVAVTLLEIALAAKSTKNNLEEQARINFRLGLVCRRAYEANEISTGLDFLSRGIDYSRTALRCALIESDRYRIASAKGALANCLIDQAKRHNDQDVLQESIQLLREVQKDLSGGETPLELLATACNSLGGALLAVHQLQGTNPTEDTLKSAFEAFSAAVSAAEATPSSEAWAAAKVNCGAVLAMRSKIDAIETETAEFLRIQSIAAYLAAIEGYPSLWFPRNYAEAQFGLARVLYEHALKSKRGLLEFNLLRALASCEAACSVFTEELEPLRWAEIQIYMGSIFGSHAELEEIGSAKTDLQEAKTRFESALRVFKENSCASEITFCKQALARIKKKTSSRN